MIYLGNDVILLSNLIALVVLVALVIYAITGTKGFARIVISVLLLVIGFFHYIVLAKIASLVNMTFLPLFILESTETGSVLYPDIGQLSILFLIILWRRNIASFIKRHMGQKEMTRIGEQESPN